jgi:hypothetical protein
VAVEHAAVERILDLAATIADGQGRPARRLIRAGPRSFRR